MINWAVNKRDARFIHRIARRAVAMAKTSPIPDYPLQDAEMDITAAHLNGCPLRLKELAEADDANFGHDVFGIRRYINRSDGTIPDIFCPRFSGQEGTNV
jgi:hypothetical protein